MTETRSIIKYILAVLFIAFYAHGQFLEFSDLFAEDPLSLIWNAKNSLTKKNQTCMAKDAMDMDVEGTCMHSVHCKKAGGTVLGKGGCGHWHSCCVLDKTCNDTAEGRVSYFRGFYNRLRADPVCTYHVKLASDSICQMRVDILNMALAPATKSGDTAFTMNCDQDNFYVEGSTQKSVQIPQMCGTNNNQHFYIHLDTNQKLSRAVSLNLRLAQDPSLPPARWAMKVRQLACPTVAATTNTFSYFHHKKPMESMENETAEDFTRLAPEGCLQYYTAPRGVVKNFGFNTRDDSSLTTNQDYAMCFKRTSGYCGVRFSQIDPLLLRSMGDTCDEEYIYVPEEEGKKCMTPPAENDPPVTWTSKHPGPLYIHYHADETVPTDPAMMQYGFKFNYDTNVPC